MSENGLGTNGDEVSARKFTTRIRFPDEVSSNRTYPKEHKGPKPIADQIKALAKIFDLDPSQALEFAKNLPALPDGAEGWFAILSVDALAKKHFPEVKGPGEKYCQAVLLVCAKIAASRRSFHNYHKEEITPVQLRVHTRTAHALYLIAKTQPGDIQIVAAQLGMRHRGKSVRRAREVFVGSHRSPEALLPGDEFGLGSLAVGSILLTHPERLVQWEQLHIDCAGDEFAPIAGGGFSFVTVFRFEGGGVEFCAFWSVATFGQCGSASAFVLENINP